MKGYQWAQEYELILRLFCRHGVPAVAIGIDTSSHESERFIASLLPATPSVAYMIVNEAGASAWFASEAAKRELPGYDVLGAVQSLLPGVSRCSDGAYYDRSKEHRH